MAKKILTYTLTEPLCGATAAKVDIDTGDGNMIVDKLTNGEQLLAGGALQYLESQGAPIHTMDTSSSPAALTLKSGGGGQPWFRLPWSACNGATVWQVHLTPTVPLDISAHSAGGNVKIDLAGMLVTRLTADTGGGNMDLVLPDDVTGLRAVAAKSGAGNVTVSIPGGMAARIQATTGLGKVIVDARFSKMDKNSYQSPDYDQAAERVEITLSSGAGNVVVKERIGQPEMAVDRI